MKKILLLLLLNTIVAYSQTYQSLNMNLLSNISPEKGYPSAMLGHRYAGCSGWYQSSKNKEYAIIGSVYNVYFVDVTTPTSPVVVDSVPLKNGLTLDHEVHTYQNYCYSVEDGHLFGSFRIIDMQYLPDSVHVVYDSTNLFKLSHTLYIDQDKLYCASVRTPTSDISMAVYSLATPTAPVLLRTLNQDYPNINSVHDMFVKNDTIYASCQFSGLHIFKLTSSNTFSLLASYNNYQYSGYNHSSSLTKDSKSLVFTDEIPEGLPIKIIDVSNLNNITALDTFRSHVGATAHNPYIVGNKWLWVSSYQDGLYLYDISNPSSVAMHGFFDTCPLYGDNDNYSTMQYSGNWSAYPYLPSKIVLALDMQNGLFVLDPDNIYKGITSVKDDVKQTSIFSLYPTPSNNDLHLVIANKSNKTIKYSITNMLGEIVLSNIVFVDQMAYRKTISLNEIANGYYFFSVTDEGGLIETKKICIQH